MKKSIILLSLTLLITGCSLLPSKKYDLDKETINYLKKNYNDNCEVKNKHGRTAEFPTDMIYTVVCDNLGYDKEVRVTILNYKDNNKKFYDTYNIEKNDEKIKEYMLKPAKDVFGDAKVYYHYSLFKDNHINDNIYDIFNNDSIVFSVTYEIKNSNFQNENQIKNLIQKLKSSEFKANSGIVVIVVNDNEYGKYSENELRSKLYKNYYKYAIRINKDYTIEEIK